LRQERASADDTLRLERLSADDDLAGERRARAQALASLLALEREHTDDRLLLERTSGDAAMCARDEFMGMVAHDMRTLLGGIALTAEVQVKLATDDEAGHRIVETAGKIRRMAASLNRLIGDLVDTASIEAHRFTVTPSDLDAGAVIREAIGGFAPAASAQGVVLDSLGAGELLVRGDHDRTLQVLANLLSNALKWTTRGGTISVHVSPAGSEVRFSVTDTGVGISKENAASIFERYWQVDGDRRGHGLGLFICKSIVEAQGGRIWVESELGEGSTFSFTLPGVDCAEGH
jgi:signal transduction histidine kinase